jgi:hypothetical protein
LIKADVSSRPEAAFVLLLMQSLFALAGEVFMAGLSMATLLLALGTCLVGLGVLWRRRWARGWAIAIEAVCLFGTAILLLLPLGFNRGLVSLLVNVVLPVAVILLVRKDEGAFS